MVTHSDTTLTSKGDKLFQASADRCCGSEAGKQPLVFNVVMRN